MLPSKHPGWLKLMQCSLQFLFLVGQLMIRNVDEKLVMKVVLPNLIKLAKDPEM